jgi:Tfp pilus assembly protein PilV
MEELSKGLNSPLPQRSITPARRKGRRFYAFALYEVLVGVTIFAIGVIALGRAVENCLNASSLSAEEARVREVLWNRMAEIQTAPGSPDASKETKIKSGYGTIVLIQKTKPANLTESDGAILTGVNLVTLTARWEKGGMKQYKQIEFYVYRSG